MQKTLVMVLPLVIVACSPKQPVELAKQATDGYNSSYRDNVIENWQNRLKDTPMCLPWRERLKSEGQKHESAATGKFQMAMRQVMNEATAADCRMP